MDTSMKSTTFILNREGDFIDRILNSGISFRLLDVGAGGIINGAGKNGTAFKPVGSFKPMVWDDAYDSGVRR